MREIVASVRNMLARAGPILERLPAGPCSMVEVGVGSGIMAEHLLAKRPDLEWHGVDSWLGGDRQPEAYVATNDIHASLPQAHQDKLAQCAIDRVLRFGPRAVILRMVSVSAAKTFGDQALNLVFLDGDHSRVGVEADIAAWWPKVRPGGWLGGHDYANADPRFRFGVKEAVDAWVNRECLALELDGGLTWWVRKP